MDLPDLTHLAQPGARIALRATPGAARNRVTYEDGQLRISVTAAPERGKANEAIRKLLARALGVPKSRLTLLRGLTGRDKLFLLE